MKRIIYVTVLGLLCLSSCVKYDADDFKGKILPRVTGYTTGVSNDWLYFNLRTGKVFNEIAPNHDIKEGDQTSRQDWDLAFCGHHLRTNSGTSGKGKGGALDLGYGNYDSWTSKDQVMSKTFTPDDSTISVTYSQADWNHYLVIHKMNFDENPWFDPNSGIRQLQSSGNPVLEKSIVLSGPPMVYTPSQHTYIIRAADGEHYYKLMIVSWFNTNSEIDDSGGQISYYLDELK
ncbi:MAG: HmuY family protein [Prevotella sp.]|nr:HmuY family protein [Prevotella sp.]MCH3995583.1 HmuY family protein [Prevotella sp.]MCI1246242.1 HmuY family protein [Prevotella sp.]